MRISELNRFRKTKTLRDWVSETSLKTKDLILPYFVVDGKGVNRPIRSLQGVCHLSIDTLIKDVAMARKLGIKAVLIFGKPRSKDVLGSEAYKNDGVVQKAVRSVKKEFKDLVVITDVCLCGYITHGHCGLLRGNLKNEIDNEATIKTLSKIALSHAEAGAEVVAPSSMADGQVRAIREALDKQGFKGTGILAYSAKYASGFYGPFRDALDSEPMFGDRKSYQMDFRNSDEALREIAIDIEEGADVVMVKPALSYMDIIYRAKKNFNVPVAAYNVSGEYAMVKAYCKGQGTRDKARGMEKELALEILTSIKRAGANFIITYWAKDAAKWLKA